MIEIPYGGDTVFSSMSVTYEGLSDHFKQLLCGLQAWHSSRHEIEVAQDDSESAKSGRIGNAAAATQDALHSIVVVHPLSGRKGLFVNTQFTTHIEGLFKSESDAILNMLYSHCQKPEYQCRVRWKQGDITMWDNRATRHKAINDYHGYRRHMHRVTVEGCALNAAN